VSRQASELWIFGNRSFQSEDFASDGFQQFGLFVPFRIETIHDSGGRIAFAGVEQQFIRLKNLAPDHASAFEQF